MIRFEHENRHYKIIGGVLPSDNSSKFCIEAVRTKEPTKNGFPKHDAYLPVEKLWQVFIDRDDIEKRFMMRIENESDTMGIPEVFLSPRCELLSMEHLYKIFKEMHISNSAYSSFFKFVEQPGKKIHYEKRKTTFGPSPKATVTILAASVSHDIEMALRQLCINDEFKRYIQMVGYDAAITTISHAILINTTLISNMVPNKEDILKMKRGLHSMFIAAAHVSERTDFEFVDSLDSMHEL